MSDTIFASATPPGRSGVAVIRVSGPRAWAGLALLTNRPEADFTPRQISVRRLYAAGDSRPGVSRETIDHAMVIPFRAPASFTGEDVVEYHLHGGPAIVAGLLSALSALPGYRMAEPGEFTRRAFENGKLDLTEAEAVADLIDAQTQMQRRQALLQLEGGLSRLYTDWTERLKIALAHLEADIEFPDEDMPDGISPGVLADIKTIRAEITAHLEDNRRGERLRSGVQIVILGAPNAGKSSLVNALAQRDVAIVSALPGTTRDVIEVQLDLGGYAVTVADTAGLRPQEVLEAAGHDAIEQEGMRRALQRAQSADVRIVLLDGTQNPPDPHALALMDDSAIVVINKADQPGAAALKTQMPDAILISAQTGQGLAELLQALSERVADLAGLQEAPAISRQRHRIALCEALEALERMRPEALPELAVEDVRLGVRALGRIAGRVDVEDLLDVIFRDFCIGK